MMNIFTCLLALTYAVTCVYSLPQVGSSPSCVPLNLPQPTLCGNAGLQWAYFVNPSVLGTTQDCDNFEPAAFKTLQPRQLGTTTYVGGWANGGSPFNIYGAGVQNGWQFGIVHRGYLYARQTGTYNFQAKGVDDMLYVWLGIPAYAGWKKGNAVQTAYWDAWGASSYTVNLVQGVYYPLRIVYVQAYGGSGFNLTITEPSGTVILGPNTGSNTAIVQRSCTTESEQLGGPAYLSWGSEV